MDDTWRSAGASDNSVRKDHILKADRFAADVLKLITGAEASPALSVPLGRVEEQAKRQIALIREPYKIGVIGEYGAGKTLFLASLLNFLDNLPIGDRATTGNVTRFRLRPVDQGTHTRVADRQVVFLSRDETARCLDDLADQIRQSGATGAGLEDLVQKAVSGDPAALQAWKSRATGVDAVLNRLVSQLVAVAASAARHPSVLGTTQALTPEDFADLVRIDAGKRALDDRFWLVRQVEVVLDVPAAVLDLGKLAAASAVQASGPVAPSGFGAGTVLELWDFPGIFNDVSDERDQRLTAVLLEDVDSSVALLKAGNPDSPAPSVLDRLLRASGGGAIAGVGNIFDSPQAVRFRTPGLDNETAVLQELPALEVLLRKAGSLASATPFLYAGLLAYRWLDPQPDTSKFDQRVEDQERNAEQARAVALRLPEDSTLRAQLLSATGDGGRAEVLAMLADQLAEHGLRRRWARVEREDGRLRKLVAELEAALTQAPEADASISAAEAEFQVVISGLQQAIIRVSDLLPLVFSAGLSDARGDEVPFSRFAEDCAARLVYRWPQWRQMLDSVNGREVRQGPELTDELLEPFGETCVAVLDAVRAEALRRWESALLRTAEAALRADEAEVASPDLALLRRARALAGEHDGQWTVLAEPEDWHGILTEAPADILSDTAGRPDPEDYTDSFPLPLGSRFVWAYPARHGRDPDDVEMRHRVHPGYVVRLRHEVVAATVHRVEAEIEKVRDWAAKVAAISVERLREIATEAAPPQPPAGVSEARTNLLELIQKMRQSSPDKPRAGFHARTARRK